MLNVDLFRRVQDRILADPEVFDMGVWHCGTTMCLGGMAIVEDGTWRPYGNAEVTDGEIIRSTSTIAAELLGLRHNGRRHGKDDSISVFEYDSWPTHFSERYMACEDEGDFIGCAKVASDFIDWLLLEDLKGEEPATT